MAETPSSNKTRTLKPCPCNAQRGVTTPDFKTLRGDKEPPYLSFPRASRKPLRVSDLRRSFLTSFLFSLPASSLGHPGVKPPRLRGGVHRGALDHGVGFGPVHLMARLVHPLRFPVLVSASLQGFPASTTFLPEGKGNTECINGPVCWMIWQHRPWLDSPLSLSFTGQTAPSVSLSSSSSSSAKSLPTSSRRSVSLAGGAGKPRGYPGSPGGQGRLFCWQTERAAALGVRLPPPPQPYLPLF